MLNGEHWFRIVIFGKTGTGKSELSRKLVEDRQRVLSVDSKGYDYNNGVICNGLNKLKDYWQRVVDQSFKIVFRPESPRADFDEVCELSMACGDVTLLVDEVDMYFKTGETSDAFRDVIRRGRGEYVELIGITQRPRQMGEIRSMAQIACIFGTHEASDLSYFKNSFGEDVVTAIRSLEQYHYVYLNIDSGEFDIRKENLADGTTQIITAENKTTPTPADEDGGSVD